MMPGFPNSFLGFEHSWVLRPPHISLRLGLLNFFAMLQLMKPSKIRLGNWEADLSKEQLQYAATDAFTSWYLYEVVN